MSNRTIELTSREQVLLGAILELGITQIQKEPSCTAQRVADELVTILKKVTGSPDAYDQPLTKYKNMTYRFPGSPRR